jgi:hypothetical protein
MHRSIRMLAPPLVVCAAWAAPAAAQGPACAADSAVRVLASAFSERYVLPPGAEAGARELRRWRPTRGAPPAELARGLTEVLRRATGDRHVAVEWIDPSGPPAAEADWIARWRAGAAKANHGISRVEILPGNVGYLAIRSFHTYLGAAPTIRAAMALVRHTDALVLDLRDNGGGDGETAGAVERTFLGPGQRSALRTETRLGIDPLRQDPPPEWDRYGPERPLAILVNGRSFSAAEAISFGLASAGRAVLVGSPTAGGAHMTDAATPLPCGFQAWIPNRRPFDPRNGTSWEGTGVTPHVQTTDAAALSAAHLHLLRTLRERSREPEERTALDRLISRLERESPDPGQPGATLPQG